MNVDALKLLEREFVKLDMNALTFNVDLVIAVRAAIAAAQNPVSSETPSPLSTEKPK